MKAYRFLLVFILINIFLTLDVYADEIATKKVKVGLYYLESAISSVELNSDNGFIVGYNKSEEFKNVYTQDGSSVVVKKDLNNSNTGAYHIQVGEQYLTYSQCMDIVSMIESKGYDAFVAYDDSYKVWIGAYASKGEAETDISKLKGILGTYTYKVLEPQAKAIQVVYNNNIKYVHLSVNSILQIKPNSTDFSKSYIGVNGKNYRGSIRVIRQTSSDMTVINEVDTNQYLYSVISSEMYPSWHIEALKAQAVAARTYLINSLTNNIKVKNTYRPLGFDINGTTEFQSYKGYDATKENEGVKKAVDDTNNLELYYKDQLISAVFFSSSGGYTENSENYWINEVPYLRAVEDKYLPSDFNNKNWEVPVTPQEIKTALTANGIDIGDIADIQVVKYTSSNNAVSLKIVGTKGEKLFEKSAIRTFIKGKSIPSLTFKVIKQGALRGNIINGKRVSSNISLENASVVSKSGVKSIKSIGSIYIQSIYAKRKLSTESTSYIFKGAGSGHGIGMSQWGAKGMADAGFTYDQILKHFYTGVEIK